MEYRVRATGAIVSEAGLRALCPDTCLPSPLTADAVNFAGADPVLETPAPAVSQYQTAQRNGVTQDTIGNWVYAWLVVNMTQDQITALLSQTTTTLAAQIDDMVAGLYSKWARFQPAYDARGAAAQAFKAAGYVGDPGQWVTAYATAAGLTYQAATDNILGQMATINAALGTIDAQRMRKYQVLAAVDVNTAQTIYADIMNQIATAAAAVS